MDRPGSSYCEWYHLFKGDELKELQDGLTKIAYTSAATSLLFFVFNFINYAGVMTRTEESKRSYKSVRFYFMAVYIRNIYSFLTTVEAVRDTISEYYDECHFFSFMETFTAVMEIEALTHMCIERYVQARYIKYDWEIPDHHFSMYVYLTLLFSLIYGLFFKSDYAGCMCYFDLVLPDMWKSKFVVGLFMLRSIKPTAVIIFTVLSARLMEIQFNHKMKLKGDSDFTKIVLAIVIVNLQCWLPFATIRGWALFSQLLWNKTIVTPPTGIMLLSIWLHSLGNLMSMVVMVTAQTFARFNICLNNTQDKKIKKN